MAAKPTKFVDEPPALVCPACKRVFREPVISVKCGHTFCRGCIEELIREGGTCPLDGQECDSAQLVLNRAVIGQIDDLAIHCCHGVLSLQGGVTFDLDPSGCRETVHLGQREEHESKCQFAKELCPVGGELCGTLRRNQMDQHMKTCTRVPCPYIEFGCSFHCTSVEVAEHRRQCTYRDESQLLAITMKELKLVKSSNEAVQHSLSRSQKAVEKLSQERSTMTAQLEQQALTITALTSRMDKLEMDLEAVKAVPLRPQVSRQPAVAGPDGTPHYNRRMSGHDSKRWSTESTNSLFSVSENRRGPFQWQMPFVVKCIGTFKGHKGTVWSLIACAAHLYSSGGDGTIKMWDIAALRRGCLKTVMAHKDCTMCLAVGSGVLFSTGTDLTLRSWHLDTLDEIGTVQKAHDSMIVALACSKEYVFGSSFGCIKVWDAITLKEVHTMDRISQSWVRALSYDRRTNQLYSGSYNKIQIWNASDEFSAVAELEIQFGAIYSLAVTRKYIVTGTHNHNIQLYDKSSLKHLVSLSGHIGIVTVLRVAESPLGTYLFSASSDTTVLTWSLDNQLPIQALQRHEKPVHSMAIWQDSVFTGSEDMEIKVFKHFKL